MAGSVIFTPTAIAGVFAPTYTLFLVGRFVAGLAAGLLFVLGPNPTSSAIFLWAFDRG